MMALALMLTLLDPGMHHLGVAGDPEWAEFRDLPAEGPQFEFRFEAPKNAPGTLLLRQRDVKLQWKVELNGKAFTNLFLSEDDLVNVWPVPAERLVEGINTLKIVPPKERDNVEVGQIRFLEKADWSGGFSLRVAEDLPCRVTVVDNNGSLAPMRVEAELAAVRPGVAYLKDGRGTFRLFPGRYTVYVGRGFEYGISTQEVSVVSGKVKDIAVELRREVQTPGWVACDTHVHTFTFSGHGDATAEERAVTLAGEGIELPISTDHNVVINPFAPAQATGMDRFFTPVPGNEVTTGHAHFNIFPCAPGSKPPNFRINEWPRLMEELRATPEVKVVILNHPRNIHNNFQPFASTNFNAETGENLRGFAFSFDAMEIVNSSAMQSDWMLTIRDWMALLNHGNRVTGLGSSDGHDVSRYIIGQGRSYVAVEDRDVSKINVERACESILKGRVLISMGLLADLKVNNRFGVGDLATELGGEIEIEIRALGPGWTAVDRVELFANREIVKKFEFEPVYAAGEKRRIVLKMPKPRGDAHLIAIASGPGVAAPFWKIPKPYQPSSVHFEPRVIGVTNPVWLDCDGDGKFTPLRMQSANN